jgi:hypothetical protein
VARTLLLLELLLLPELLMPGGCGSGQNDAVPRCCPRCTIPRRHLSCASRLADATWKLVANQHEGPHFHAQFVTT